MNLIIRHETIKDYYKTELMTQHAFWNLHAPGCQEHYLVHLLRNSSDFVNEYSLIATDNDELVVGAIFYVKAKVILNNIETIVLTFGPLCVEPSYQNLGIGKKLIIESIKLIDKTKYSGIIIYGEPNYYPKLNFVTCDKYNITTEYNTNFPAFMCYDLGSLDKITGKFYTPRVYTNINDDDVNKYNALFPYMEMKILPTQWKKI